MIKLKKLISEMTLRPPDAIVDWTPVNQIDEKIDSSLIQKLELDILKLEQEWDRLDSMGNQESRQQQIAIQLEKLRKEKIKWEKLYGATL